MPSAPVKLSDVAQAAGVHVSTASRALAPDAEQRLRPGTVSRVRAAAERLGYRPDLVATGLRRRHTASVGVVAADLENPFNGPLLRGISATLEERDFVAVIAETLEEHDRLQRLLDHFTSRRVSALIIAAA